MCVHIFIVGCQICKVGCEVFIEVGPVCIFPWMRVIPILGTTLLQFYWLVVAEKLSFKKSFIIITFGDLNPMGGGISQSFTCLL